MDAERIAAIRARADAATDGPWDVWRDDSGHPFVRVGHLLHEIDYLLTTGGLASGYADADLIAHAPTDLRDLLAEVERLTAERDALAAQVERVRAVCEQVETDKNPCGS